MTLRDILTSFIVHLCSINQILCLSKPNYQLLGEPLIVFFTINGRETKASNLRTQMNILDIGNCTTIASMSFHHTLVRLCVCVSKGALAFFSYSLSRFLYLVRINGVLALLSVCSRNVACHSLPVSFHHRLETRLASTQTLRCLTSLTHHFLLPHRT